MTKHTFHIKKSFNKLVSVGHTILAYMLNGYEKKNCLVFNIQDFDIGSVPPVWPVLVSWHPHHEINKHACLIQEWNDNIALYGKSKS